MADEDGVLPLAAIAERTGVSVRSLREWCATGRLACERIGGAWTLPTADLNKVRQQAKRHPRPSLHATLVLPADLSTTEFERQIIRALGPAARNI